MELIVQLGTRLQDERVLELLSFPGILEDPDPGCRIEIWTSGRRISRRRKRERDAVALLGEGRWNEAFLACGQRRWEGLPNGLSVAKRIALSPRNRLWKPPFSEAPPSRNGSQVRATHESLHNFVAWNEMRSYPTIVRIALRVIEGALGVDEDELFQQLARLIWQGLSERVAEVCSFGCVDVDDRGLAITDTLAPWPTAISELGRRFDDLHPMLLGDRGLCLRLEKALGPRLPVTDLVSRDEFGMLVLGRSWDASLRTEDDVGKCLVRRRGRGRRAADASRGEYALGEEGRVHFYIERDRFIELFGAEALTGRSTGARYWETLDPEVCALAGVTPAEILVAYSNAPDVAEARARIRRRYDALDEALTPRQRAWKAHEEVFHEMGEALFGAEAAEVIELLHRRFSREPASKMPTDDAGDG